MCNMHFLAQLIHALCQPLALVLILLLLAVVVWRRRPRLARLSVVSGMLLLALTGWHPLSDAALRPLDDAYAPPTGDLSKYAGVVVLGGAILGDDGRGHGQLPLGDSGERIVEALRLLHQYPSFRLIFSGGDASATEGGTVEADQAKVFFEVMGVGAGRAMYERNSRNTSENAANTRVLLGADSQLPWLLVTSASHMRRALATFRKAGVNVTPYPVDYQSNTSTDWTAYSLNRGAEAWRTWAREVVGYAVYKATGRI